MLSYTLVDAPPREIGTSSGIGRDTDMFDERTNDFKQGQLGTDSSLPARVSMYPPQTEAILDEQLLTQASANPRPFYSSPLRTR